jgi:hypothetical protein
MKQYLLKPWNWFKRRRVWAKISLITILVLSVLLFFANTIVRKYVNANGEDLMGRRIHLETLHFNDLTFSATVGDMVIYEENKKDVFMSVGHAYVNLDPWKMMSDEYAVTSLELDHLYLQIIQYKSTFNFSDLASDEPEDPNAEPTKFTLQNVKITNSEFKFVDVPVGNSYPLHNLNVDIPEIAWNGKKSEVDLNFSLGKEGRVAVDVDVNNETNRYKVNLNTKSIDLNYIEVYLKDYFNVSDLIGKFHSDLTIQGSMINAMDITMNGQTGVTGFDIKDGKGNKLFTADSIGVSIDSMNVGKDYYGFNQLVFVNPDISASYTKTSSNIDYVLAPLYAEEISDSASVEVDTISIALEEQNPFYWGIREMIVKNGTLHYDDYSLDRPFKYTLSQLNLNLKNIDETSRDLPVEFAMITNGQGAIKGTAKFDMLNGDNMNLHAAFSGMNLVALSPFSEYYVGAPMTQGTLNYNLDLTMTSTEMVNDNAFDIRELEFGKKIESDSAYKLPIKLALILLKDKNDNIQFEIPVTGNPSDPEFRMLPVIWQTTKKFFAKAASQPFRAVAGLVGTHPEELERLPFDLGQEELDNKQHKILDEIVEIHAKKPSLKFTFDQTTNIEGEKIQIAIIEAKKQFSPSGWKELSDKDSDFRAYLVRKTGMTAESSIEDMSVKLIGSANLPAKVNARMIKRNKAVVDYLTSKGMDASSFNVTTTNMKNLPEQMKKPQFKIEVSVD